MTELLLHLPFCFAGVCAFAYLFRAPRKLIAVCGAIGTLGYALYSALTLLALPELLCFFAATLIISLMSEAGAIIWKSPALIFLSTSIFVLVPGLDLYKTVSLLVFGDYYAGAQTGIRTVLIIGAMAMAIAVGTFSVQGIKRLARRHVKPYLSNKPPKG